MHHSAFAGDTRNIRATVGLVHLRDLLGLIVLNDSISIDPRVPKANATGDNQSIAYGLR